MKEKRSDTQVTWYDIDLIIAGFTGGFVTGLLLLWVLGWIK